MFYYAKSLLNASFLMVNSTWTKKHIDAVLDYGVKNSFMKTLNSLITPILLRGPLRNMSDVPRTATQIVYPPCDTKRMSQFLLTGRRRTILSLAQFRFVFEITPAYVDSSSCRPEKDHAAQLYSLAELFKIYPEYREGGLKVKLVLVGSSRNAEDAARVEKLKDLAHELSIRVSIVVQQDPFQLICCFRITLSLK